MNSSNGKELKSELIPLDKWDSFYSFPTLDVMKAIYKNRRFFKLSDIYKVKNRRKYLYPDKFFKWLDKREKTKENLKKIDSDNLPVSYKKVYSIYQYDKVKYSKIYAKLQALSLYYDFKIIQRASKHKILKLCYLKDDQGKYINLGDELHIFRYAVYHKILNEIAEYLTIAYELEQNKDVLNYLTKRTNIIVYNTDEEQKDDKEKDVLCAEFQDLKNKPFNIRFKVHCRLLKGLYKGLEIEEAAKLARKK